MEEIFRSLRVGDVDDRRAVQLVHAGKRIERRQACAGHRVVSQRVMPGEEDVPIPWVAVDHGLVRRAVLKGIEADKLHVLLFSLVPVVILVLIVGVGHGLTRPGPDHRRGSGGLSRERRAGDAYGAGTYPDEYFPAADADLCFSLLS